jgi:hypothetical protein
MLSAAAFLIVTVGGARADLIDNFNSENGGVGVLNYFGFANWKVTSGSVDLIGNGFFDFYPGNGLYVDLDGSTNHGGTMVTKQTFAAGTYAVSFDLAGSARGDVNIVDVAFGPFTESFTVPSNQPYTLITRSVTLPGPAQFSITNEGGDDVGAILDNVSIIRTATAVPEPATLSLASLGILGLAGHAWRRRRLAC